MIKLTPADLFAETAEMLPDRDTLFGFTFTHVNAASVMAANSSVAANLATILSVANSAAMQNIAVGQG
ncbi:hypothetical protein [Sinomonas sp.]|uniref:hypothetical protein n=1 Tax=Sinomonas sp. TaxID=1914986 RepID=UPI002FE06F7B